MARKTGMDIERVKQQMEIAHEKKMAGIDRGAEKAKGAEEESYRAKMQLLDKAAERIAAAAAAASTKASDVTADVTERASEVGTAVGTTASGLGEVVGEQAGKLGKRVGAIRAKTRRRRRARQQSWIFALAATVLLLALGMSVGRRYFAQALDQA